MPVSLAGHSSVCWGDSAIFVVGGPYTGSGTNLNVHYYGVNSDTWGTITNSLPAGSGRRTFALGLAGGNKILWLGDLIQLSLKTCILELLDADASQITWAAGQYFQQFTPNLVGLVEQHILIISSLSAGKEQSHGDIMIPLMYLM